MDPDAIRIFAGERELLLRGMFAILAILAAGLGWFSYSAGARGSLLRRMGRWRQRQRRQMRQLMSVTAGLKADLLAGATIIRAREEEISQLEAELADARRMIALREQMIVEREAELLRVDGVRRRTEEGCRAKHDELEMLQHQLAALIAGDDAGVDIPLG